MGNGVDRGLSLNGMRIQVRGLHTTLTPVIKEYAEKRFFSLSKFVKNNNIICEIELVKTTSHHKSGDIFKAEAIIDIGKEHIYAVSEKTDLYQAVDDLRNELEQILSSRKEKKITLFRKGAYKIKNILKNIGSFKKWSHRE